MADSLLASLSKYRPREDQDPRENVLTEAFAWLLRQHRYAHPAVRSPLEAAMTGEKRLELLVVYGQPRRRSTGRCFRPTPRCQRCPAKWSWVASKAAGFAVA